MGKNNSKPESGDERVLYYHSKYVKYSRAIAIMWGVLVISLLIIILLCLIQPTWFGSATNQLGSGAFGLWRYDRMVENQFDQKGSFLDLTEIPSAAFQAATVFVLLAVLLIVVCVLCFFLFICISSKIVFIVCGWILVVVALFMLLACIIYPAGWDATVVQEVCGSDAYSTGNCHLQWTYILAIISIFDAIILAVLAFVLAIRHVKPLPWQESGSSTKKAYVVGDDRSSGVQYVQTVPPSYTTQPVVLVDQGSVISHPVGTLRSQKSSKRNFQL
ncbi:LHFPL tetraspan subfamily member 5 protein-like [Watersipora subatra]|uniref:LHFPL tetraspan subfamily member 5 protein-like n=1 Tax=Watersipora subatra TaxID=2589382 RepID=UPI00355B89F0